ncbi:MAG TPA: hypothetical protein VNH22_04585 [Blastocatellia bacterium]|jgi:hypothetical protein|nr:hypothetical protein [Blastocatellia bacterium]
MITFVITLSVVFLAALGFHAYKRVLQMRAKRMADNEYNTAVTLWKYSTLLRTELDLALRQNQGVLDYGRITVPHSSGYKVSLELEGYSFRVKGIPEQYNRSGRLSFYVDNSLIVRGGDHEGDWATLMDEEYAGTNLAPTKP